MMRDELDITVGVRIKATGTAVPMGIALGITSLFFGGVLALWAGGSGAVAIVAMLSSPAIVLGLTYSMLRDEKGYRVLRDEREQIQQSAELRGVLTGDNQPTYIEMRRQRKDEVVYYDEEI